MARKPNPKLVDGPVAETIDPFDPARLRLNQDFADTVGVKKLITTVPVGRPSPTDFFRVHPHPDFRLTPAAIIPLREERETYLVLPEWAERLPGEFQPVTLFLTVNRQKVLRIWPVRLPTTDGRASDWHRSAAEAAEIAFGHWVRIKANMSLGAYDIVQATSENLPDPEWGDLGFRELLSIAFKGRLVDCADHPIIQRLQGAV